MYKPLKNLFILIGIYAVLLYLGPTAEFRVTLDKIFRICIGQTETPLNF